MGGRVEAGAAETWKRRAWKDQSFQAGACPRLQADPRGEHRTRPPSPVSTAGHTFGPELSTLPVWSWGSHTPRIAGQGSSLESRGAHGQCTAPGPQMMTANKPQMLRQR